ncbi:hypothetical protein GKC28_04275 [Leisingera sp. ANG59]|nr:metallophosphoesterase [Leisingera sp. ANG59]NSY37477.1 hypothetical protein [Leisingera sp. ANG59]
MFQKFTRREPFAAPQPDEPLCVIGDVNGCFPQLLKLLEQLPPGHRCILVGDYIDRGEQCAEVLRHLSGREDLTCLMGNHEAMLLGFLQERFQGSGTGRVGNAGSGAARTQMTVKASATRRRNFAVSRIILVTRKGNTT